MFFPPLFHAHFCLCLFIGALLLFITLGLVENCTPEVPSPSFLCIQASNWMCSLHSSRRERKEGGKPAVGSSVTRGTAAGTGHWAVLQIANVKMQQADLIVNVVFKRLTQSQNGPLLPYLFKNYLKNTEWKCTYRYFLLFDKRE